MRILIASAPHRDTFGYSMPPPGLLRLGGELERAGADVALEDLSYRLGTGELPAGDDLADAACARVLARGAFDVVGLSVMGATLPIALAIAERVRARAPRTRLWLGGPGTTGLDARLLERFPFLDLVVRGEGERTVLDLCRAFDRGDALDGIAGITWRDDHGVPRRAPDREPIRDLDEVAAPAYHLLPSIADYKRITGASDGLVPIDSGRGCVFDCSFCTIGRFWSRRSRTLSARRLADEVEHLKTIEGARAAYLCHDIFGANRGQAVAFCAETTARGLAIPFEVRARADHLDRELLQLMGRAGCYRVLIGVESAEPAVRERNQKGMRRALDVIGVVDDCVAAGVTPILSLILGLPGEDEGALEASLDLCARAALRAGVNLSLHLVNPQPGSGLGEEHGARARPIEGIPPDMAWGAGETAPERALVAAHPDVFSTFALLPEDEAHLRALHAVASELPDVLMRFPRTFALLRERADGSRLRVLDVWRAWKSRGRSFESEARAARIPLIDEMLDFERALVRAAARDPRRPTSDRGPRAEVLVVAASFDLVEVARGLRDGLRTGRERRATWFAVGDGTPRGPLRRVVTSRITADVARVLALLDGTRTADELEALHPGMHGALERLRSLVTEPAAQETTP